MDSHFDQGIDRRFVFPPLNGKEVSNTALDHLEF